LRSLLEMFRFSWCFRGTVGAVRAVFRWRLIFCYVWIWILFMVWEGDCAGSGWTGDRGGKVVTLSPMIGSSWWQSL